MVALSSAEKSVPKVRQAAVLIVIRHVYSLDLANEPASLPKEGKPTQSVVNASRF